MTNHGLNVLTYYYMDQADNLANEVEEDVLNSNPHYAFIQAVRVPSHCLHLHTCAKLMQIPAHGQSDW